MYPPPDTSASTPRGEDTREALLLAATTVFARAGFDGVSLREVAEAAKVNQALIGYHFGSKEGLYLAVFERIAAQIRAAVCTSLDGIETVLGAKPAADRHALLGSVVALTDAMLGVLASERSAPWAQLIAREQQAPTAAFTLLYDAFMGRVLSLLTRLVRKLKPRESDLSARLLVATILGQVMVFRVARAGVLRHMQWQQIGATELAAVQARMRRNLEALLAE